MKIRVIVFALAALVAANNSHAESTASTARQAGVFVGSAVAGALVAGPVGYLAGGLTGAWLATKVDRADRLDQAADDLDATRRQMESLSLQLDSATARAGTLERDLHASLEAAARYRRVASRQVSFELLFRTGESELSPDGDRRLQQLAAFLADQPEVEVTLSGYADPRGEEEFNLALSEARVRTIAAALAAGGVDATRIKTNAFGDRHSSADEGDLDAYALERRVTIELSAPGHGAEVARRAN